MRTALLHCGLHKTGTTAVQVALRDHAEVLEPAGFLSPRAGRIDALGGGHHNLAWQLTGDRRFRPEAGDLAALEGELATRPGNPILSSEDFETLLGEPARLAPLLRVLRGGGGEVRLLVYLRDQLSYLEAMYRELLWQGDAIDFTGFVEAALRDGVVRLRAYALAFDYRGMLDGLAAADVGPVTVRNYHTLAGGSTVTDLCAAAGLDARKFGAAATARANPRVSMVTALQRFVGNHAGRALTGHERLAIGGLVARIGARRVAAARATRLLVVERFRAGNLAVCSRFGLARTGLGLRDGSLLEPDLPLERLFSVGTREVVGAMADALQEERPDVAARLAGGLVGGGGGMAERIPPHGA